MEAKRTSVFENSLIWFGAGVSIAEILTGTYLAPLGFQKGLAAILIGGQIALFIYDRAYDYVQVHVWGKMRGRVLG